MKWAHWRPIHELPKTKLHLCLALLYLLQAQVITKLHLYVALLYLFQAQVITKLHLLVVGMQ